MSEQDPIPGTVEDIRPALMGMVYIVVEAVYKDTIPLLAQVQAGQDVKVQIVMEETDGTAG
jgi:hypothetical protein